MSDGTRKDHPPVEGAPQPEQRPAIVISDDEIEAARHNKAAREFLRFALEQEQQLERDGHIRP